MTAMPARTANPAAILHTPGRACGRRRSGEEGYILVAVIFLMLLMALALSIAAPKVAADIQRDREVELMHRGKQFQRAIQLYYRKFGAYPPTMDALEKQNEIRFLRRRYKDPMTGKDEWHLIHMGEAKTQTLGFFGQPIAGTGAAGSSLLAGVGPGATPGLGSPIGNPQADPNAQNNQANQGNQAANPNDPNAANAANGQTAGTDSGSASSSSPFGSGSGNQQTFGGGGIIGVESTSPKLAILEYKKKKHYNEWEFIYDPLSERMTVGGASVGQPIGGQGAGNGIGIGNSPTVNNPQNGIVNNPAPTPAPANPQQ
jgi:type II secretory pathway pseudopilin PulG